MRASDRRDPPRWDGAASLVHAGLTVYGRRHVEYQLASGRWLEPMPQQPGTFYLGNLCAPWHQVQHSRGQAAEPLWRRPLSASSQAAEPACAGGEGVHIAIMLRSGVCRGARARSKGGEPCPVDVYRAINACVAAKIAADPLRLPSLAECMAE